jgi:hypothetical protein
MNSLIQMLWFNVVVAEVNVTDGKSLVTVINIVTGSAD